MIIHFHKKALSLVIFASFILAQTAFAQNCDSPESSIRQIIRSSKGTIGVAAAGLEDDFSLAFNKNKRFPMQSVFKFPLALAILDAVDKGKFSLDQKIRVTKQDLRPNTWSPLREDFPEGTDIALRDLLSYTVSKSDNNGCDILFRLAGGTKAVETYIHRLGIKDIAIAADEAEMAQREDVQYRNWNKPPAMIALLKKFYTGKILSASSTDFLKKIMVETATGQKRIKGSLPAGTIVAHKTGTSGTNDKGIAAATNDVGIVTLPNGRHFAIVVYVSGSAADEQTREAVIADITKVIWDFYQIKK